MSFFKVKLQFCLFPLQHCKKINCRAGHWHLIFAFRINVLLNFSYFFPLEKYSFAVSCWMRARKWVRDSGGLPMYVHRFDTLPATNKRDSVVQKLAAIRRTVDCWFQSGSSMDILQLPFLSPAFDRRKFIYLKWSYAICTKPSHNSLKKKTCDEIALLSCTYTNGYSIDGGDSTPCAVSSFRAIKFPVETFGKNARLSRPKIVWPCRGFWPG
jgi:hypothetical protein